jgi:hypothetical protein
MKRYTLRIRILTPFIEFVCILCTNHNRCNVTVSHVDWMDLQDEGPAQDRDNWSD